MQSQTAIIQTLESDEWTQTLEMDGCLLPVIAFHVKTKKIFQRSVFIWVINYMQKSDYMQNKNYIIGETIKRSAVDCSNCQQIWYMKCQERIRNNKICPKLTNLNHSTIVLLSITEVYCLWDKITTLGFLFQFSIRWEIQISLHYLYMRKRRRISISNLEIKWVQKVRTE